MKTRTFDPELDIERRQHVAVVEMRRPPHNYFDPPFLILVAKTLEELDRDPNVRAMVLCAQGAAFSAGSNPVDPR